MGYGTYQVLTHNQPLPSDVLYATLGELAKIREWISIRPTRD